ncbi:MAG: purine-nucleoside phosphorylase [Gemmatimonadales bacterium]|nr:purine-nucleoside phosphorylase [Gemmatimonadales bacterium]
MRGLDPVSAAADALEPWLAGARPEVAIILGSGLGRLTQELAEPRRRGYREVPGFPLPAVEGHAGELVLGALAGRPVLCQSGRFHAYEGHAAPHLALPVRVFAALGIRTLIVTNAAGGIRRTMLPGSLMLLADQVNLTFRNPLHGPVRPGEARFPDMSAPFDPALRLVAQAVARAERIALAEGVYAGVLGPSYETPAEIRMLERLGADAVGMSTVPEVVAARAAGLAVLGVSVITNWAAGLGATPLSHAEVMAAADAAGARLVRLVTGVVARV